MHNIVTLKAKWECHCRNIYMTGSSSFLLGTSYTIWSLWKHEKKWEWANVILYIIFFLPQIKNVKEVLIFSSHTPGDHLPQWSCARFGPHWLRRTRNTTAVSFDQEWSKQTREGMVLNLCGMPYSCLLSALGKETDLFVSETANWPQRSSINTLYRNVST